MIIIYTTYITVKLLKDGNLITNVFNRLIRTCFYAIQNNYDGKIPNGDVSEQCKDCRCHKQCGIKKTACY